MRRLGSLIALVLALSLACSRDADAHTLKVVVPDADNLQYMAFWVAKAAGFFHDEGIEVAISNPRAPSQTRALVEDKSLEAAVLPPPIYLELIADKVPIVLVANLLKNDPINLVVRRSIADERGLSASGAIADRLAALRGLKVGVAPHPPRRLRALFASVGLDADKDITMVILRGPDQNAAFTGGAVDALYAHTPFLERALVDDGAVLVVNQSAGEVPALAGRQIHALAFARGYVDRYPDAVRAATRAIDRALKLAHSDPRAVVDALAREFPTMDRKRLDAIVRIYEPALPATPEVSIDELRRSLDLFPANREPPRLDGVTLSDFVEPGFARGLARAPAAGGGSKRAYVAVVGAVLLGAVAFLIARARRARQTARV